MVTTKPPSPFALAARAALIVGVVLLLVGNLIPVAHAKGVVLVLGEIFSIAGLVGMAVVTLSGRSISSRYAANGSKSGASKGGRAKASSGKSGRARR